MTYYEHKPYDSIYMCKECLKNPDLQQKLRSDSNVSIWTKAYILPKTSESPQTASSMSQWPDESTFTHTGIQSITEPNARVLERFDELERNLAEKFSELRKSLEKSNAELEVTLKRAADWNTGFITITTLFTGVVLVLSFG